MALVFVGHWGNLTEGAVAPAAVVDGFDPGADVLDRLRVGGELVAVVELGLQGGPEALVLGVVPVFQPGRAPGTEQASRPG